MPHKGEANRLGPAPKYCGPYLLTARSLGVLQDTDFNSKISSGWRGMCHEGEVSGSGGLVLSG
jgi:hypothetical protein